MKTQPIHNSTVKQFLAEFIEYALAFTVIVECNSLFHYSENYRGTSLEAVLTVFAICFTVILLGLYALSDKTAFLKEFRKAGTVLLPLGVFIILFFAVNVIRLGGYGAVRKYVLYFVLFLPLSVLLFRAQWTAGRPYELLYKYADLVCLIALCNLAVYAVFSFRPEIIQAQPVQTRWSGMGYLNTLNNYLNVLCIDPSRTTVIAGCSFYKNLGFFGEPPMMCIPLNTALFTELFLRPKREQKPIRWLILGITVLTSQAALGIMLAVVAFGLKVIRSVRKKTIVPITAITVLCLLSVVLICKSAASDAGSISVHLDDYIICFKTFLRHPLFGCGFVNEAPIRAFMSEARQNINIGLSNTIAVVFAEGGLFLGTFCILPIVIGIVEVRSKHNKDFAFWMLGPLALFCVTVFMYHLLFVIFVAYGYSMLELTKEGSKRRIRLMDQEGPQTVDEPVKTKSITNSCMILLYACIVCTLFVSPLLWQSLHRWLNLHQLYLGESASKVYFFFLFLLLTVLVAKKAFRIFISKTEKQWAWEIIAFIAYSVVYSAMYPLLYSWVSTLTARISFLGDLFETAVLAGLYFGGVVVLWLLAALFRRNKRIAATVLAGVLIVCTAAGVGARWLVRRTDCGVGQVEQLVRCALGATNGSVFSNEQPAAFRQRIPGISYTSARDGGFSVLENASIITAHDRNLRDLLNVGYQVGELSKDLLLYSNDPLVIRALEAASVSFYPYYAYDMPVNDEDGILKSGTYTLTVSLRHQLQTEAAHEPVCRVEITSYGGKRTVTSQTVFADEFDNEGKCEKQLVFTVSDIEGVECRVISEEDQKSPIASEMTLRETPEYITRRKWDGRLQVLYETYYDLSGAPKTMDIGYAAFENTYDKAGHLIRQIYLDTQGRPTLIKNGFAGIERDYDLRGRMVKEAYLDPEGNPVLCADKHYARLTRIYLGRTGIVSSERYYGADGALILSSDGCAGFDREFDEKDRIIREVYLGTDERPILLPAGYAIVRSEYNEDGKVSRCGYYSTSDEPISIGMGYASVSYEYAGELLALTAYYDAAGNQLDAGSAYLHQYLLSLAGSDLTIFIAIKDEGTKALTQTLMEDLNILGVQTDLIGKFRNSYYAVISSEGVKEEVSAYKELICTGIADGLEYSVSSAGFLVGDSCSIIVNGVEYAKGSRGMNIVVFDHGMLLDSLAADTCSQEMQVIR